jgi:hypothetical protein
VRIYRPIILLLVLYGHETWSLTVKEHEDCGQNTEKKMHLDVIGNEENCIMKRFVLCAIRLIKQIIKWGGGMLARMGLCKTIKIFAPND